MHEWFPSYGQIDSGSQLFASAHRHTELSARHGDVEIMSENSSNRYGEHREPLLLDLASGIALQSITSTAFLSSSALARGRMMSRIFAWPEDEGTSIDGA